MTYSRSYEFDRELRLLCLDAIERIEVAVRSAIVNELSVHHGPHFYCDRTHYERASTCDAFMQIVANARYLAITHYRSTYDVPTDPPIWAVTEALTFGQLSHLYSSLTPANRKRAATAFGYDEALLVSWLKAISTLRNVCAHHNRLWNTTLKVYEPKRTKALAGEMTPSDTFYARVVVLAALLGAVDDTSKREWRDRLAALLLRYPTAPPRAMGFLPGWESRIPWA